MCVWVVSVTLCVCMCVQLGEGGSGEFSEVECGLTLLYEIGEVTRLDQVLSLYIHTLSLSLSHTHIEITDA